MRVGELAGGGVLSGSWVCLGVCTVNNLILDLKSARQTSLPSHFPTHRLDGSPSFRIRQRAMVERINALQATNSVNRTRTSILTLLVRAFTLFLYLFAYRSQRRNARAGGGGDEQKAAAKGPTFVGKPRIIPKDGGALIVMECRVKSASKPSANWFKDGSPVVQGSVFNAIFVDEGDQTYLCQLEIRVSFSFVSRIGDLCYIR